MTPPVEPPSRPRGLVASAFLRALLENGERAGVDRRRVLTEVGVPQSALTDANGWVGEQAMRRAWISIPELSGDSDFGLRAAEAAPAGSYGLLEFATIASRTALEALERVGRYYRMLGALTDLSVVVLEDKVYLTCKPPHGASTAPLRHFQEHLFALLLTRARALTDCDLRPLYVKFRHPAPQKTASHDRVFRCPVEFGSDIDEMVIGREALDVPLQTSNSTITRLFDESTSPGTAAPDVEVVSRVRGVLQVLMQEGNSTVEAAARRVGMSVRTIQRRLHEQDTSFAQLLDDYRKEMAERAVAHTSQNFGEIGFAIGFSQPSAFTRAFKRWTGQTPAAFRRNARLKGAS